VDGPGDGYVCAKTPLWLNGVMDGKAPLLLYGVMIVRGGKKRTGDEEDKLACRIKGGTVLTDGSRVVGVGRADVSSDRVRNASWNADIIPADVFSEWYSPWNGGLPLDPGVETPETGSDVTRGWNKGVPSGLSLLTSRWPAPKKSMSTCS